MNNSVDLCKPTVLKACHGLLNQHEGCLQTVCQNGGICIFYTASCSTSCFCPFQFTGPFSEGSKEVPLFHCQNLFGCVQIGPTLFAASYILLISTIVMIVWMIYVFVSSLIKKKPLARVRTSPSESPDVCLNTIEMGTDAERSVKKNRKRSRFLLVDTRRIPYQDRRHLLKTRLTYEQLVPVVVESVTGFDVRKCLYRRYQATTAPLNLQAIEPVADVSQGSSYNIYASYATSSDFTEVTVVHAPKKLPCDQRDGHPIMRNPSCLSMGDEQGDYEDSYGTLMDYTISLAHKQERMSYEPTRSETSYAIYNDENGT